VHALEGVDPHCERLPPLRIVFSDPQCAVVGQSFADLRKTHIVIGHVDFREQSRVIIEGRNTGVLRLYVESSSGRILGAEMVAPEAEHLAHLLAACIQTNMTVQSALQLPFYHPTLEEGCRQRGLYYVEKLANVYTGMGLADDAFQISTVLHGEAGYWLLKDDVYHPTSAGS
jgi:hypothetical protein